MSRWYPAPIVIALLGIAAVAIVVLASCGMVNSSPPPRAAPNTAGSTAPNGRAPPPTAGHAVLAVKIDNVDAARPATGLVDAAQIYVEPVEAGLTRLIAVYTEPRPPVIGPVRSARITDLELLAQFGRPQLAFSGAAPPVLAQMETASVLDASPARQPNAYFREAGRPAPHNLYLRPARLPSPPAGSSHLEQPTGPPPAGGVPTTEQRVRYPAASFDFRWSPGSRTWLVSMDASGFRDTADGQLGAGTVVIQQVSTRSEGFPEDSGGSVAPIAQTVGTGRAQVLRDGESFSATWSRPTPGAATTLTTAAGQPLPFAPGQTWVVLVSTSSTG